MLGKRPNTVNFTHSFDRLSNRNEINALAPHMSSLVIRYAILKINDNMNVNQGGRQGGPHGLTRARPGGCVVRLINHNPKNQRCVHLTQLIFTQVLTTPGFKTFQN